jgi:hypothetical protein
MSCYVYLMGNFEYGWFKIGRSSNPVRRWKSIDRLPFGVSLLGKYEVASYAQAKKVEKALHEYFYPEHMRGEWYHYINAAEFQSVAKRADR